MCDPAPRRLSPALSFRWAGETLERVGENVGDSSGTGLGLVEFLTDLRADLEAAQVAALRQGGDLRLGVEQVTVSLEVVHERTTSGELAGKITGKFWVFGSAEAAGKAGHEVTRAGTQSLTLTLRPRVETAAIDDQGRSVTRHVGLDVHGAVGNDEQQPPPPAPAEDRR